MPNLRKLSPAEVHTLEYSGTSQRKQVEAEYDEILRPFVPGDCGQVELEPGEKRLTVRNRPKTLEAAQHDAIGEPESLSRGGSAPGSAALRRVISNPISGEQIVIHTSGAETNGKLLVFELFLPPGKQVPSRHTHPIQEERFTILAGTMRFRLGWLGRPAASLSA